MYEFFQLHSNWEQQRSQSDGTNRRLEDNIQLLQDRLSALRTQFVAVQEKNTKLELKVELAEATVEEQAKSPTGRGYDTETRNRLREVQKELDQVKKDYEERTKEYDELRRRIILSDLPRARAEDPGGAVTLEGGSQRLAAAKQGGTNFAVRLNQTIMKRVESLEADIQSKQAELDDLMARYENEIMERKQTGVALSECQKRVAILEVEKAECQDHIKRRRKVFVY